MFARGTFRFIGYVLWVLSFCLVYSREVMAVPDIQAWSTASGLRVFYLKTEGLPLVDIRVVFDAGSARDGDQYGLANLTSNLLDTGAGSWTADQIAARLENVGAILGAGASRDSAFVSIRSLTHPEKLKIALDTAHEILVHPRFDTKDFDREKARALLQIKQQSEDPAEIAEIAFMKQLYGSHPYAHPPEGLKDSVTGLARKDLVDFHREHYVASNGIIAIVGDISRDDAAAIAEGLSVDLPKGSPQAALTDPVMGSVGQTLNIPFPSEQTHVFSGALGMKINDPDYFPLYVGNHILGGSGLVSRIMDEVREKRGFAYSAYSYFFPLRVLGPFEVGLQTKNAQADEALKVAISTVKGFVETGPSDAELDAAKKNIIGGFVLRLDSNSKLVSEVASIGFFNRPLDYLDTFTAKVKSVTKEDVRRAMKARLNPSEFQTVLVGGGAK